MAEDKKPLTLDEVNARQKRITEVQMEKYKNEYNRILDIAQKKNPSLPSEIFSDIKETRERLLPELTEKFVVLRQSSERKMGDIVEIVGPNEKEVNSIQIQLNNEFERRVAEKVKENNLARGASKGEKPELSTAQVKSAYEAVGKEKPGIMSVVSRSVYDEDKGGAQWGGIIGGIAGLLFGMSLGGGLDGGLMGILTAVFVAAIGVWGGNKLSETFFPAKGPSVETEVGKGKAIEKGGVEQGQGKEQQQKDGAPAPEVAPAPEQKPQAEKVPEPVVMGARVASQSNQQVQLSKSRDETTFFVDKELKLTPKTEGESGLMMVTVNKNGLVTRLAVADQDGKFNNNDKINPVVIPEDIVFKKDDSLSSLSSKYKNDFLVNIPVIDRKDGKKVEGSKVVSSKDVNPEYSIDLTSDDSKQKLSSLKEAWAKSLIEKGVTPPQPQQGSEVSHNEIAMLSSQSTPSTIVSPQKGLGN